MVFILMQSQTRKHKEEIGQLQGVMQVAAHDASKDLQSKQKRINQLENKVNFPCHQICIFWLTLNLDPIIA